MVTTRTALPDLSDTIVALSSAVGSAPRAIVRLSGRRAANVLSSVCPDFAKPGAGNLSSVLLRLPGFHSAIPADVYFFARPRTYTGEDVVEIHTISCLPIVDAFIAECLHADARAAQPGEFTMRAFLSGKLDLTRAEAVLGVIEAADRHELQYALKQLAGGVSEPMRALREDLLNLLADIEAALDFADEDVRFVSADDLLLRLGKGLAVVTLIRKQLEHRALEQRPFRVVLAGRPNAGKSSLFNALVGEDAALVDAEPGTTRDYLERQVEIDGVTLELVDTAGERESADAIEASAQTLAMDQARDADLVVRCIACGDSVGGLEGGEVDSPAVLTLGPTEIAIATKADLGLAPPGLLATSAATGAGLAELRRLLADRVRETGHAALAASLSRCRHHVDRCLDHLRQAHAHVIHEELPELLALEVRLALEELGAMAGAVHTDDLLDRIFSRFCIGK
ncbi:MAG: tRNA modification GTPase [Planctomycetes bacterium]|nr:tRNA modification GTPase [Planctomycetota bacterium]